MERTIGGRKVIGLYEEIVILSNDKKKGLKMTAKTDTGATLSSIHSGIVKELSLGPTLNLRKVRNAHGMTVRPIIEANIIIHGKPLKCKFSVTDRSNLKSLVLIGMNILSNGFLIDPTKSHYPTNMTIKNITNNVLKKPKKRTIQEKKKKNKI